MNKCNIGNLVKQIEAGSPCLCSSLSFSYVVFSANCSFAAVFRCLQSLETQNFRSQNALRSFNTVLGGESGGSLNSCQVIHPPPRRQEASKDFLLFLLSLVYCVCIVWHKNLWNAEKKRLEELLQISYKLGLQSLTNYIGLVYTSLILLIATKWTGVGLVQQKNRWSSVLRTEIALILVLAF